MNAWRALLVLTIVIPEASTFSPSIFRLHSQSFPRLRPCWVNCKMGVALLPFAPAYRPRTDPSRLNRASMHMCIEARFNLDANQAQFNAAGEKEKVQIAVPGRLVSTARQALPYFAAVLVCLSAAPALAATVKAASAGATGFSLIPPTDEWGLLATLVVCAAAGLRAEKTQAGAALSAPLVTSLLIRARSLSVSLSLARALSLSFSLSLSLPPSRSLLSCSLTLSLSLCPSFSLSIHLSCSLPSFPFPLPLPHFIALPLPFPTPLPPPLFTFSQSTTASSLT